MKVTSLPFNSYLGLLECHERSDYILKLESSPNYLNHLETVHASAQFSLAEATSGEFLLSSFGKTGLAQSVVPVVRRVDVKYKKPAKGTLYSKASFENSQTQIIIEALEKRGRALVDVRVDIFSEEDEEVMTALFTWFIQKIK